ncbi:MAG: 3,4-dihydroxy-2-butanone-4-phosphate synthase [Saprospiraceae bacterium]
MTQDLEISEDVTLHSIEEALEDITAGKLVIVVDDEDRENEGDFICAAEKITPELINFMATHGRGLICTPILEERAKELEIDLMVKSNTAMHNTAFTVSIDLIGQGCTTGISAYDRATGIKAMVDPNIKASDFARPGHIFPLIAKNGGVLRRTGHTEAAVDLARLCGFYPAGVLVEILNEDGTMARLPQLLSLSKKLNIKIITIKDLVAYRMRHERLIKREMEADLNTEFGPFKVIAYKQINNGDIHLAITRGIFHEEIPALVKVHSNSETGDILGMLFDGYSAKLIDCLKTINKENNGALLIMRHGDNSSSVLNKLKSIDTNVNNNPITSEEQRDFGIGAQILNDLGISKIRLISHHSKRRIGLVGYGLEIVENIDI